MVGPAGQQRVERHPPHRAGGEPDEPRLAEEPRTETGAASEGDVPDSELRALAGRQVHVAAQEVEDADGHVRKREGERRLERAPAARSAADDAGEPSPLERVEAVDAPRGARGDRERERPPRHAIGAVGAHLPRRRGPQVRAVDERDQTVMEEIVERPERRLVERVGAEHVLGEVVRERRDAADDAEEGGRELDPEAAPVADHAEPAHVAGVEDWLRVVTEADGLFGRGPDPADACAGQLPGEVTDEREERDPGRGARQLEELAFDVAVAVQIVHSSVLVPKRAG